ncbi:LacI family DNA-binding transcriptional regulator [Sphingobacterium faecale]|uniref:LacI family DNA-binding transcriptional regulator n=1 Tax=Sphingobacterium faecale TaxID=2803775 RepID=A0ABS1R491_9SPHI|nr:LacI family DNA-binding transcriptional regulator [Sphingobacterium faecale]MBL1408656.1 LacI family DNA-binding transcriptional regulator [Sphingobacterium faecale]
MQKNNELSGVKEIARRANVSIATVDRVIHNRSGVSAKTKEKIEAIIKEMDYKPNLLARSLASKKNFRIAVLIPRESPETEYWKAPLEGINRAWSEIRMYGVEVVFFHYELNDRQTFNSASSNILNDSFHGVILAPSFISEALEFFYKCEAKRIKCVFINSDISNVTPLSYIGPDLFQSGKLAGNLSKYLIPDGGNILIFNVSRELGAEHHLLKKATGFKSYFEENKLASRVDMLTVHRTDYDSIMVELENYLRYNPVDLLFVTNSRVSTVAKYFETNNITNIKLIGYDYLSRNIEYLEKGIIDFLICQKPIEQGYKGLLTLYEYFIESGQVDKVQLMPIDILTKENYKYYKN